MSTKRLATMLFAATALVTGCGGTQTATTAGTSEKPAAEQRMDCPQQVLGSGDPIFRRHTACIDNNVVGDDVAKSCSAYLEAEGWGRDISAEMYAFHRYGRQFTCYRSRL